MSSDFARGGRLRVLIWKEFLEIRMNPRLFGIVVVAPILQLAMLGYAATTDVKDVPIVVADGDRSSASRELIQRFDASRNFTVIATVTTVTEVEPFVESGTAWIALAIPAGHGADIATGRPAVLQAVADGTDSNSTTAALGYATALIGGYARELVETRSAAAGISRPDAGAIDARIRVWFNPQLESRHFMIPGVLALVLLLVTANLAAMAIVREKEIGTLEQLNVTPLRRWELIAGKLLPYGLIGILDILLVTAVAVFWFEVPLRGSFWLLFTISLLYVLCTLALGLLVSTISETQQQAMMTATFFFLMPMIYLSGFMTPIENMPEVIQCITYVIPLRYFLVIVRGIFLKGVGFAVLWPQVAALAAWGTVVVSLAVMRSSKRLD
ncbi:MAG TPA: ABC transporter permease [Vicinamibacterales bacterium]|nr:ABC transporter permease [Vicinamibacterales bacterium]